MFCCIAIVAVAILYFIGLWCRQVFSGPRRDRSSPLPAPPRALTGKGALPVYGHTIHFQRLAGSVSLLFDAGAREIAGLPAKWTKPLGDCFAIYIWGQWRVSIKGPERARRVFEEIHLKEAFPWTPPVMLLGKSCFAFLEDSDAEQLRTLLRRPLAPRTILGYAAAFAERAEECLEEIKAGTFGKRSIRSKDEDDESESSADQILKVKWEALRSYTLDLLDGPILATKTWTKKTEQTQGESTQQQEPESKPSKKMSPVKRETMLLWMERMKAGVDVIKMTFGPEWMYIWLMNEYGRALNARTHVSRVFSEHIAEMSKLSSVQHRRGRDYYDPATRPIPLLTLRDNMMREKEGIFGTPSIGKFQVRQRSLSAPSGRGLGGWIESDDDDEEYVAPYSTEQDLARPKYSQSPLLKRKKLFPPETPPGSPSLRQFQLDLEHPSAPRSAAKEKQPMVPLLERLLQQQDLDGNGLSQAVTCELAIILWMMMDVGNAWTAMALNLLSSDKEACQLVQEEIDTLEAEFGQSNLFTPSVLGRMRYLDALLYEAIRMCPAFLGGLKQTTRTIEFKDIGVQLPKNSHIFFCQPTTEKFNIHSALGRKPEHLGREYPCVEL